MKGEKRMDKQFMCRKFVCKFSTVDEKCCKTQQRCQNLEACMQCANCAAHRRCTSKNKQEKE